MTIKELKTELEKFDENAEIYVYAEEDEDCPYHSISGVDQMVQIDENGKDLPCEISIFHHYMGWKPKTDSGDASA